MTAGSRPDPKELRRLVVVPDNRAASILVEVLGMSPLTSPLDGAKYGSPSFQPWWDYLEFHPGEPGYYEMVICVGNSGWAAIVLIRGKGVLPELLDLCRTYAEGVPA